MGDTYRAVYTVKIAEKVYVLHCFQKNHTLCDIMSRGLERVGLRVFKNAWFGRFARKDKISADLLWEAVERAERGLIDADLGGGVIKQRIARPGAGKSKGYRSIVIYRKGEKAFFVYGFPKSELGNIRDGEEEQFKKAAKSILALSDDQIRQLIENGQFEEVMNHGQEISK